MVLIKKAFEVEISSHGLKEAGYVILAYSLNYYYDGATIEKQPPPQRTLFKKIILLKTPLLFIYLFLRYI